MTSRKTPSLLAHTKQYWSDIATRGGDVIKAASPRRRRPERDKTAGGSSPRTLATDVRCFRAEMTRGAYALTCGIGGNPGPHATTWRIHRAIYRTPVEGARDLELALLPRLLSSFPSRFSPLLPTDYSGLLATIVTGRSIRQPRTNGEPEIGETDRRPFLATRTAIHRSFGANTYLTEGDVKTKMKFI